MQVINIAEGTWITEQPAFFGPSVNRTSPTACSSDEGQIIEEGPPAQILGTPREERAQRFLAQAF